MEQTKRSVIQRVEDYVRDFLHKQLPENREYHDSEHTVRVVAAAEDIGRAEGLSEEEIEILKLAAWFHDTGHSKTEDGHEEVSAQFAEDFLSEEDYPQEINTA